ncbi:hypothetical protein [Clostridium thermarum]|uniref:hypothetical protein n=1 Tax=Clostridium thermarum TaxID=1716543 RepID=UPI001123341B|nr:hypothetical protein [Clostridium thermarum]
MIYLRNHVDNTRQVLSFIEDQVKPDYHVMKEMGIRYEEDSALLKVMSKELAVASKNISSSQ